MAKKGKTNNPNGRPKGSVNKDVKLAREAIASLVESTVPQMQGWLEDIKEEHGPLAAWKCVSDVMEYHLPKLARTENKNSHEGEININVNKRVHSARDID
jgi:hypothetical protein